MSTSYQQTLNYLYTSQPAFHQIGAAAYKPGLDNTLALMQHLGNPHNQLRAVHIAGTNGKGSTSHLIAAALQAQGYKVGLFTSPHLVDFRERIRINGQMIPEQQVVDFVDDNRPFLDQLRPSFFETTMALAFWYFVQQQVDIAVVEVGLGGRLDSTNVLTPLLSVITNIGIDHTEFLGDTLPQIAAEKAGIIKKSIPIIVGQHSEAYDKVFAERAAELNSRIIFAEDEWRLNGVEHFDDDNQHFSLTRMRDDRGYELDIDLLGDYQRHNIVTACAAADYLAEHTPLTISRRALREGLQVAAASTGLAGRWQVLSREPYTVCDTGHNADGIRFVAEQLANLECDRLYAVMGFAREKELSKILALLPVKAHYIFTRANIERARAIEDIAAEATKLGLDFETAPSVKEAVERARSLALPNDAIFIGGSNYVIAEI